jgi:hypothetical protein
MVGCLEGIGETGDAAADDQKIVFDTHEGASFLMMYTECVELLTSLTILSSREAGFVLYR